MGITVENSIMVFHNDIIAIVMAENASSVVRTRNLDTRYPFIRWYVEVRFLKIVFLKVYDVNKLTCDRYVVKYFEKING
jgi:hypothetical protein